MLTALWSVKGGSGTSVTAAAFAIESARQGREVLLVDFGGDLPAILGMPEPAGPGVEDWLAEPGVGADALTFCETSTTFPGRLIPTGKARGGSGDVAAGVALAALLAQDDRHVIVDCGTRPTGAALAVAQTAGQSLLVLRPCYLALRRAAAFPLRPSRAVLVAEAGRSLAGSDVEAVLGVPTVVVPCDEAIARAVDCGTLAASAPRRLVRSLRGLTPAVVR